MTTTNALVYYHELVKAGMPDEQAFNQAMAFDNAISHLATKDELKTEIFLLRKDIQRIDTKLQDFATKEELKTEISLLRKDLEVRFSEIDANFKLIDANFATMRIFGWAIIVIVIVPISKIVFGW